MDRWRVVAFVLVAVVAMAGAEDRAVLLSNAENLDLYYAIDPPGLTGPDTSSAVFVGKVVAFFSEATPEVTFSRLPPLGVERLGGLAEGAHVFVGFFVVKGATDLPVRVLRLQAGGGIEERLYTIYREPATTTAKSSRGRVAALLAPPEAAGAAAVEAAAAAQGTSAPGPGGETLSGFWRKLEPIVTFTGAFEPEIVVRQTEQGTRVIPFASASSWGADGVRLREVRIARRSKEVVFRVQTFGSMSTEESLLLYVQEDRSAAKDNRLTIEITPGGDGKGGYVLLWSKGSPKPALVGKFALEGNVLLGRILYADASSYIDFRAAPPGISMDICTGHHDAEKGSYEEFYHATIRLDQIPVVEDESALFL